LTQRRCTGAARVWLLGGLGVAFVAGFLALATRGDPAPPPDPSPPPAAKPRLDLDQVAARLDEFIAAYGDENMAVAAIRPLVDRTLPADLEPRREMLLDALASDKATVRWIGLLSVYHYGDGDARLAKLLLIRTFDDAPRVAKEARAVLGNLSKLDEAGTTLLEQAYPRSAPDVQAALLRALVRTRPRELSLKSRVMRALQSEHVPLRRAATYGLSRLDFGSSRGEEIHPHDDVIDPLREALTDPDAEVRFMSAMALSRFGPAAARAVPDLVLALADDETSVARWSETALSQIGPAALPALEQLLQDGDPARLSGAVWILRRLSTEGDAERILREGAQHDDPLVRAWSLSGLVDIDAQGVPLVDQLGGLLEAQSSAVVRVSLQALARMGRRAAPLRAKVEALGESEDREIRRWARAVLVGAGKVPDGEGDGGR
jgi:hypothetical protein